MEQVTKNIEEFVKSHEIDLCDRFAHEGFQPLVNEMYRQNKGSFNEYGCYTDTRLWTHCYSTMESLAEKQNPSLFQILTGRIRELTVDEATKVTELYDCIDVLGNFWRTISNKLVVVPGFGSHSHEDPKKMYDISSGTFQLVDNGKSEVMIRFVIDNKTALEAKVFASVKLTPVKNKFDILNAINQ